MRPLKLITPAPIDGEHGPVMLSMKACGCWFNRRQPRMYRCPQHRVIRLRRGDAATRAKAISAG